MSFSKNLLAASIIASLCMAGTVLAQDAAQVTGDNAAKPNAKKATELSTVIVTGIRDSEAEALNLKQEAVSHVEIVTAEDIGKLPAKNVADTLQRLPGVNISSSSASEGGFDENDRVALRGTNPSMTQTLVNGHTVGTGDWFVLSQVQTVGRSVSYSLLPAEIVSQVVVHKTSEANIVEGGSAGSVDIITRRPLEFAKQYTAEASVGGVYSDLPSKTEPQFSGLFNWKNNDNTFGILGQAFYEKRSLERDGQEVVGGYAPIGGTGPLAGVYAPQLLGTTLFTQKRERKGGVVDIEFKPTDNVTLDLSGFYSKMKADNYNRNYMIWTSQFAATHMPAPGYVVSKNGVLTSANFLPDPTSTAPYGVYDMISRPGASSQSKYITLDGAWNATDHLTIKGQAGTTEGRGDSPNQDVLETGVQPGGGAGWLQHGLGSPYDVRLGADNSSLASSGFQPSSGWIFGDQNIHVKDKEHWGQLDGELAFDDNPLSSLQFGVRYADHTRENKTDIGQGPLNGLGVPSDYPQDVSNYPGHFGDGLGATFPSSIWYYTPGQLAAIDAAKANRDPIARFNWQNIYKVEEKDKAAYLQANFTGAQWAANVGVRYVRTEEDINYNTSNPDTYTVAGPFLGSAFGTYYASNYNHTYSKALPSANFKWSFTDELVGRLAASKTMTRPDYSALAGSVSLDDLTHTGSGGNPQLKPIISTNFDAALEWYFAPRGLLSFGVYKMNLKDYVNFGPEARQFKDQQASIAAGADVFNTYLVSVPVNVDGSVKGAELNYIQPIGENFGVSTNYTLSDGHTDKDDGPLQGNSKRTANVSAYFENKVFNARVSYTYRSEFFAGVSRTDNFYQRGIGNLALSMGYSLTENVSLSFDAMNLNRPVLKYYTKADVYGKQPYAFYDNGRQYYLNVRFKF